MSLSIHLASLNVFYTAYSQSDFFGKLIFLGLFFLSALCWIILAQKTWQLKKVKQTSSAFQQAFEKNKERILQLEMSDMPHPAKKEVPHPFGAIFEALKNKTLEILNKNLFFASQTGKGQEGVHLSPNDIELVESHALTVISQESKKLEKNLFILSTIVTLAPFLGLLGTVWGILITFSELHGGGSAGSNSAILGGLSTALATTVLGLVIAIPALVSFNYLKNCQKLLASDMEDFLYHFLSTIEIQYRKAEVD